MNTFVVRWRVVSAAPRGLVPPFGRQVSTLVLTEISTRLGGTSCDWELKKQLLGRKAHGPDGWCVALAQTVTGDAETAASRLDIKPLLTRLSV